MKYSFFLFISIIFCSNVYCQSDSLNPGKLIKIKITEKVDFKMGNWGHTELQYVVKLGKDKAKVFRTYQSSAHPNAMKEDPLEYSKKTVLINTVDISILDSLLYEILDSTKRKLTLKNLQISQEDLKNNLQKMTAPRILLPKMDPKQRQKLDSLVQDTTFINKVLKKCIEDGIRYDYKHHYLKKIEFIFKNYTLILISESQGAYYLPWKIDSNAFSYNRNISKYLDLLIPQNSKVSRSFYIESDKGLYESIGEEIFKNETNIINSR